MLLSHFHFVIETRIFIIPTSSSSNNEFAISIGEGDRRNLGRERRMTNCLKWLYVFQENTLAQETCWQNENYVTVPTPSASF